MTMRLILLCALLATVLSAEWNYDAESSHGPSHWPDKCVDRHSKRQSPIDIRTSCLNVGCFESFCLQGYEKLCVDVVNNGHSVQASVSPMSNALLQGGGLDDTYKLAQLHFHWGSNDRHGSEHRIDGREFPMEVHFVHYNTKYEDIQHAVDKSDGLAVLGWMFELSDTNKAYEPIFEALENVRHPDDAPYKIHDLNLLDLMGCTDPECLFFRYRGSLTTPPCYQSVTWTVFEERLEISSEQLETIRNVLTTNKHEYEHEMVDNYRPIQPINDRQIWVNDDYF